MTSKGERTTASVAAGAGVGLAGTDCAKSVNGAKRVAENRE